MLAAQAAHRDGTPGGDEESISTNTEIADLEKRAILQKSLHMAASNGETERVERLLHGAANAYIDINAPDEEGTAPIIYASCFVSSKWICFFHDGINQNHRVIMKWFYSCLRRERKLIDKIEISGRLLCGP